MKGAIRCLILGHRPNELFEYSRVGVHRFTYCVHCGQSVTHIVGADRPLPVGAITDLQRQERLMDAIDIVLREALTEHGLPFKKHRKKPVPLREKPLSGDAR